MKSQIRGLLLWVSALIEGCSWQERRTEASNGAGMSLRIIYIWDILLNYLKGIFRQLIKKKKNQIPFRNPVEEIITGCPECLKKPLDHSDNIKTTLVCLVGTWGPVPKGGPGISPTPIFCAMCYLRRTYEKPLCSQNYLLIKVYLSSTRFCLFTSRAGVPPRCAYANHRHRSKLTTCP